MTDMLSPVVPGVITPRGATSAALLEWLSGPVRSIEPLPLPTGDPVLGEDAPLALHLLYELHYRGLPGVDEAWEWEPSILRERHVLEQAFERRIDELVAPARALVSDLDPVAALRHLARGDGPSLSARMEARGTLEEARELLVHRSAYQLKEADPHTWAIPRLTGRSKAALVEIQKGEYGDGEPGGVHATLFAQTMRALDLDPTYGAYLDLIPGWTLSTSNLMSLFGLHRRWRGALVGHLALFEMCSVGPMGRYSRMLQRLGFGPSVTRFYDEHVVADEHHQVVATDALVAGLLEDEPALGEQVVHGALALQAVEAAFTARVLAAWDEGRTSLLQPLPTAGASATGLSGTCTPCRTS